MIPIDYIVFRPPTPASYIAPEGDCTNVVNEDLKSTFYITPDCIKDFDPFDNFLNDTKEESQKLSAFHCVYPGAKTTILYSHGNAEDIGQLKKWMIYLSRYLKCNTIAYDYQGYGCSNNTPTEKHFFSDIRLAFKFLTDCKGIPSEDIIIYGRSIGSGPTTDLLKECVEKRIKLKGVVLQSPLLSAVKTKFNAFTVPDFFIADMMKNEEKMTSVCNFSFLKNIPILIFHGKKDIVVPYEHGYTLYKIASSKLNPNEKSCSRFVSLPDAGHNNCESLYFEDMMHEIKKFILERNEERLAIEGALVEKPSVATTETSN